MSTKAAPANYRFRCRQGSRILKTFTLTDTDTGLPIPITGYVIRMKVRDSVGASATVASYAVGSGFTLTDPTNGVFTLSVSAVTTAGYAPSQGYVYDLELVPGGVEASAWALLAGVFSVDAEVTT